MAPKKPFYSTTLIVSLILLYSCSTRNDKDNLGITQLEINWRLVGNNPDETCQAEFKFINGGDEIISNENWILYFNQNTLATAEMPDSLLGIVEHVNGDLYRFLPGKNFRVKPRDTIIVKYAYKGFLIKERDSPVGAYFVHSPGKKNEQVLIPGKFSADPFDNLEAIFPDPAILSTVPTASNQFEKNKIITVLPSSKVGKIIPRPARLRSLPGRVAINDSTKIFYTKALENEATFLAASIKKLFGIELSLAESNVNSDNTIKLGLAPGNVQHLTAEAYHLLIKEDSGVDIKGTDAAGVFYGIQSLIALLWADQKDSSVMVECVEVFDAPRFVYRGFLLDVARNFQKKKDIFRLIDLLSAYKINKLNIRISDDEGWRIDIKGIPELTAVGGRRGHGKNMLSPSFGSGPFPDAENNYGTGFYSREDFKEILKYAHQRHIEVIPEVCFPSHARAAIMAMEARYEYYMGKNQPEKANEFRLIDPNDQSRYLSAQMYKDNIVNVALPSVFHFYETIVKDFIAMYEEAGLKMTVFNVGGDEVPNGAWTKSTLCAALLKSQTGIKDFRQLQGYFMEKAIGIFEKYELQITGWEEIVLNKDSLNQIGINTKFIGKKILPLVWDNTGDNIDLGYRIANAGYPVVLCNVTNLYFDLAYNTDPKEPGLYWGGFQDAIDPYLMSPYDVYKTTNYDVFGRFTQNPSKFPGKQKLDVSKRSNIVGLQAQLWSETLKGPTMMEYYLVPKIFAFAEKAWSPGPEWETENDFNRRNKAILYGWNELANRIGLYEYSKIDRWFGEYNYRIAPPGAVIEKGWLKANTAFVGQDIRYTIDGTDPTIESTIYSAPVEVSGSVKIRSFNKKGRGSRVLRIQ